MMVGGVLYSIVVFRIFDMSKLADCETISHTDSSTHSNHSRIVNFSPTFARKHVKIVADVKFTRIIRYIGNNIKK